MGAKDGDEVVIEAGLGDMCADEVVVEVRAMSEVSIVGGLLAVLLEDNESQTNPGTAPSRGTESRGKESRGKERKGGLSTDLYCLSSSMTWMPWSYCWAEGASPTAAKLPFMFW